MILGYFLVHYFLKLALVSQTKQIWPCLFPGYFCPVMNLQQKNK